VIDIFPTIYEVMGGGTFKPGAGPALPGKSLVPAFAKDNAVTHDAIFFHHEGNKALRMGDWKIVSAEIDADGWELYNLKTDRAESHNLAAQEPERVKTMAAKWQELRDEFTKEAGPGVPERKGQKAVKKPRESE
jgi:arylsulfatase